MDSELGDCRPLEVDGALVAKRRVPPGRVIEPLDVVEDVGPCGFPPRVVRPVAPLGLHRRKETFHDGVVPAVARATHAASDAEAGEQPLELLARVLTPLVGVVQ